MLDIDHFKTVNDELGLEGDKILRACGEILAAAAGAGKCLQVRRRREFALILDKTDIERATAIAEELRTAIESRSNDLRGITISLGVAEFPATSQSAEELIYRADACYVPAKSAGKTALAAGTTWRMWRTLRRRAGPRRSTSVRTRQTGLEPAQHRARQALPQVLRERPYVPHPICRTMWCPRTECQKPALRHVGERVVHLFGRVIVRSPAQLIDVGKYLVQRAGPQRLLDNVLPGLLKRAAPKSLRRVQ